MPVDHYIIWIFGCQRSGTTATLEGLGHMADSIVAFREINDVIHDSTRLEVHDAVRLKPLEEVREIFAKQRKRVIVAKPLMESQRARELLSEFPNSCGLWLLRDYRSVAASMMKKWGTEAGFVQLLPILHGQGTWREEGVSAEVVAQVQKLARPNMPIEDGCALFWYVRNSLLFHQRLEANPHLAIVSYEKLVKDPGYLAGKLRQVGIECQVPADFYQETSLHKGKELSVSPRIARLCDGLMERLNAAESAEKEPAPLFGRLGTPSKSAPERAAWRHAVPVLHQVDKLKRRLWESQSTCETYRDQSDDYKRRYHALKERWEAVVEKDDLPS